jgi:Na+/alanine symporter
VFRYGLLFSIRTRFTRTPRQRNVSFTVDGKSSESGSLLLQALSMSLAGSRVQEILPGATAIAFGGPGAMFWM